VFQYFCDDILKLDNVVRFHQDISLRVDGGPSAKSLAENPSPARNSRGVFHFLGLSPQEHTAPSVCPNLAAEPEAGDSRESGEDGSNKPETNLEGGLGSRLEGCQRRTKGRPGSSRNRMRHYHLQLGLHPDQDPSGKRSKAAKQYVESVA